MDDSFYVGAYWGSRRETLSEVAEKTTNMLVRLSEINSHFSSWYELGISRKKASEKKVLINTDHIKNIYQKKIKKGEINSSGFTNHSFSLGLWTGHSEYESSNISISAGGVFKTNGLTNRCVLKLPYEGVERGLFLKFPNAKSLIDILINIWNPDYALFSSQLLVNKNNGVNGIGWITYKKKMNNLTLQNNPFIVEHKYDGQLIYLNSLNEDVYDYKHIDQFINLYNILQ